MNLVKILTSFCATIGPFHPKHSSLQEAGYQELQEHI
jgi:hypothetical protein